jgi:RNA polymerase subunit RPABC4/transcription elongation factor Spt4
MPESLDQWGGVFTFAVLYGGLVLIAFWVAMIVWVYRDMRARSRDPLSQMTMAVMVAILTLPGLLIYMLLRPRETLSEAYERSLEEEALLQEIEEKPACPGCGQRVREQWQACPNCHTRLKKSCLNCRHLLELAWDLCPYCATPQSYGVEAITPDYARAAAQTAAQIDRQPARGESRVSMRRRERQSNAAPGDSSLEFVDTDEYR